MKSVISVQAGAFALSALALLSSCSKDGVDERPRAEGPNVLLIVLDTLRRDRLTSYGYERETTPRIDVLAAEGTSFTQAYSVSSWTCPSHASLFTGLYPAAHGVTQESWVMDPALETLAERFSAAGYRTLGIAGNPMVGSHLGFDQGFDQFHEVWREKGKGGVADHPAVQHFETFTREKSERPFFAFVNFIEVHSPYVSGPHLDVFLRHPDVDLKNNHWRAYYTGKASFEAQHLETLSDRYDGELLFADALVGELVDRLKSQGRLEDTVVVVTSDHGEHFGAHGMVDHVFNLYEGNVAIPLLIRYPSVFEKGARVDAPTQIQDLFPTLLSLTGNLREGEVHHGVDLSRLSADGDERELFLSYAYPAQALGAIGEGQESPLLDPFRRRLWATIQGGVKTIVSDDGSVEIFDLVADPDESVDLSETPAYAEHASQALVHAQALVERYSQDFDGRSQDKSNPELDEETLEQMRRLGYAE